MDFEKYCIKILEPMLNEKIKRIEELELQISQTKEKEIDDYIKSMDNLYFISLNCDGEQREFSMTVDEFEKEFYGKCDLPCLDDPIVCCKLNNTILRFEEFSDMVTTLLGEQFPYRDTNAQRR